MLDAFIWSPHARRIPSVGGRQHGTECNDLLGIDRVALMFLSRGPLFHQELWRRWLHAAHDLLPLANVQVGPSSSAQPNPAWTGGDPQHVNEAHTWQLWSLPRCAVHIALLYLISATAALRKSSSAQPSEQKVGESIDATAGAAPDAWPPDPSPLSP